MTKDTINFPGSEKRKYPRVKLSLLVQFKVESFDEFLEVYATDLSTGGMFIRTNDIRPEGDEIYFQFTIRSGQRIIEGLGKVVRVNPPGGQLPAGMGIEFLNLDNDSQQIIDDIIKKRFED